MYDKTVALSRFCDKSYKTGDVLGQVV